MVPQPACIAALQVIKVVAPLGSRMGMYHGSSLFASQANGFMQKLGHLLIVGVILPPWPAGNEAIVLQLGYVLFRETLHTHMEGLFMWTQQGCLSA